jgi:hypothetical protein
MKDISKLALTEPAIFQTWEAFPCVEMSNLPPTVKIRWFEDHWEVNSVWADNCSDHEFIGVLQVEVIRLMLKHPFGERSKNNPKAWLASQATLYDNYNCDTNCKYKSPKCERTCPYTQITPTPQEMEWEGETKTSYTTEMDELGIPRQVEHTDYTPGSFESGKWFEKYIELLRDQDGDGDDGESESGEGQGSGDGEGQGSPSPQQIAKDNSEGWGSTPDSELAENKVEQMIKQMAESDSGFGSLPAGIVEEIKRPKVVKQDLNHFLKGVKGKLWTSKVPTRMRINRRFEFYKGKKKGIGNRVLIALDTSGSMSEKDMQKCFHAIESLKHKAELWICYCDTETTKPEKLKPNSYKLSVVGRGGTDLNPVLQYSREFDYTIMITDGDMPFVDTTIHDEKTIGMLFVEESQYEYRKENPDFNKMKLGFIKGDRP